jgi:methyl-accepting chemotaxis protein
MGTKNGEGRAPLTEAAAALEAELGRFEELSNAARKVPLDSEKNLGRAARALAETADSQERTAALVRALVEAINRARDHQQQTAEVLLARAEELKAQTENLEALLDRFKTLGADAREIQALVQQASERGAARDIEGAVAILDQARQKIDAIAIRATDLASDAKEKGIGDVEREADSLRQQLLAARNKLGLLQQGLSKPKQ